jgi:ATP-dependent Lon protease
MSLEARRMRELDADHYGLDKTVKERILEYLAVRKLNPARPQGPILCFVGPPGVGKTSLGQSIARATRTQVPASRSAACTTRPKSAAIAAPTSAPCPATSSRPPQAPAPQPGHHARRDRQARRRGFRGDPASALLEVLDPEQNNTFRDNYLGVPFDLSKVLFITTANQLDTIPGPLRDRMEIIQLPGYTEEEKLEIARRYLVRARSANGLKPGQIDLDDALRAIIATTRARPACATSSARSARAAPRGREDRRGRDRLQVGVDGRSAAILGPRRVRQRDRAARRHARRGHRPGLDAGRRRHPVHRGQPKVPGTAS